MPVGCAYDKCGHICPLCERWDSNFDAEFSPPTFHNIFHNQDPEMDQEDAAMDIDPPQFVAPILHQMFLPGAPPAASGSSKKSADRSTAPSGMTVLGTGIADFVGASIPLHRRRELEYRKRVARRRTQKRSRLQIEISG
ncbi:hypothetical protein B0H16DRAFT_1455061 [Mycena metata]|uniref:Uncharacterized protein n=1 Tax=Mycena metata TaxID=1033252 RepID=A0AAD7JJI1_9AGAR|nr:hypothetical protein B0H16DRAFT_1455061 [Mycena metata]